MFSTMINRWRKEWEKGDFPFYYCQIAPYDYEIVTEKGKPVINSAFLREQQAKAELMNENVGMAVLTDVGMEKCIHPADKRTPGERLARLAVTKTQDVKGVTAESPYFNDIQIKNDTVIVNFERSHMLSNTNASLKS